MTFAKTITGAQAVQDVMRMSGLGVPGTVVGSSDKTAIQMLALANEVGQRLIDEFNWQFMARDFTITTVIGQAAYDLPDDFNNFISDASWNRTTRLPAVGGLTEQEWQMLKARQLAGTTFTMLFRIDNNTVEFYDTPSVVQTIVLSYSSRGWVELADTSRAAVIENEDDVVLFDPQLFKTALRLAWYEAKEFDTTRLEKIYLRALAMAKSKDTTGRTLSLSNQAQYPYLGVINMPDTGYGS